MTNNTLEQVAKRLGEALTLVEEQQATIRQQEARIQLLEARLAKATTPAKSQPPSRPWLNLGVQSQQ